jgi:hypothetical protein
VEKFPIIKPLALKNLLAVQTDLMLFFLKSFDSESEGKIELPI